MAGPLLVRTLEQVVELRLHGRAADLEGDVRRAWSRCLVEDATDPQVIDVRIADRVRAGRSSRDVLAPSPEVAMELLTQAITLAGIEHGAGRLLMLHACGLVDPGTGRALVLAAPSGTGKSTAARHLGVRWGYLSDETVALRADGSVVAYPKALSLREGARWKVQASPDDLGLLRPEAWQLGPVAILDRTETGTPAAHRLPLAESVARLAEHTSYLPRLPRPLHALATAVGEQGCWTVSYSSSAELDAHLRTIVAAP